MGAIATLDQLINTYTGGTAARENLSVFIDSRTGAAAVTAPTVGRELSMWTWNKSFGGTGAAPTASAIPVNDTAGAFGQTDPTGGRQKWLMSATLASATAGTFTLYDRLVHSGGLSGTVTSGQTTNLPTSALTRYGGTASVGNQIWLEIYTIIGTSTTTVTASYTNQAGTASRTTKAASFGATGFREVDRVIRLSLQDGDSGVRSVESVTVLATTGTAGNFGVTIARPLLMLPIAAANTGVCLDLLAIQPSVLEVLTDACLSLTFFPANSLAPQVIAMLSMVEA